MRRRLSSDAIEWVFVVTWLCCLSPRVALTNVNDDMLVHLRIADPSSDVELFGTTAPPPPPNFTVPKSTKQYLSSEWSSFWKSNFDTKEPFFASRDLYIIVLLQSLLQSTVPVPSKLLRVEALAKFLLAHQLLPPGTDADDISALLEDYRSQFGQFLNDPAKRFDHKWVPIPVELQLFFKHIRPTKDSIRQFGDIIDQFLRGYLNMSRSDTKHNEWSQSQRQAEILVTVVPRYFLLAQHLNSQRGAKVSLAFYMDVNGKFVQHRRRVVTKPLAIARILLPDFETQTAATDDSALAPGPKLRKKKPRGKYDDTEDSGYPDSAVGQLASTVSHVIFYALISLILMLLIVALCLTCRRSRLCPWVHSAKEPPNSSVDH